MKTHLYILTGASRGMGLAMAQQLLGPQNQVLCISRQTNPALANQAQQAHGKLDQWSQDLNDAAQASERLVQWLAQQGADSWASATLINNAGVIATPSPLSQADAREVVQALRVGLEAPMLLSAAFLHHTTAWAVPRRILNISSGLGRRAMASQSPYCAAKAGLDHFTRCLALEEAAKPNGARVCSMAPGVIDTDMQVQLRDSSDSAFPDRSNFVALKQNGQLTTPEAAAKRLLDYLARPEFGSQTVADIREV